MLLQLLRTFSDKKQEKEMWPCYSHAKGSHRISSRFSEFQSSPDTDLQWGMLGVNFIMYFLKN